jgi:hypothetical protein
MVRVLSFQKMFHALVRLRRYTEYHGLEIAMTNDIRVVGVKMSALDESSGKKYDRHQPNPRKSARHGNPDA